MFELDYDCMLSKKQESLFILFRKVQRPFPTHQQTNLPSHAGKRPENPPMATLNQMDKNHCFIPMIISAKPTPYVCLGWLWNHLSTVPASASTSKDLTNQFLENHPVHKLLTFILYCLAYTRVSAQHKISPT